MHCSPRSQGLPSWSISSLAASGECALPGADTSHGGPVGLALRPGLLLGSTNHMDLKLQGCVPHETVTRATRSRAQRCCCVLVARELDQGIAFAAPTALTLRKLRTEKNPIKM